MVNVICFAYESAMNMGPHARTAVDSRAELASARVYIGSGRPPMKLIENSSLDCGVIASTLQQTPARRLA
jgi:hypothetical protein